ncbi:MULTISPECIES: thioesterase family protein [unclassified Roseobacter]|nr:MULTISPECIES: thioesterase family protein [unclassified Roseobacter]
MRQKVLFKHCDPAGIVFYPRYFEMMNDCVEAFFDEIGHPFETLHQSGAVPTAQIEAEFTAPSRHGDQLAIDLGVTRVGRSSLGIDFIARTEAETRFEASAVLVHVGSDGRPVPWPTDLKASLMREMEGR